MLNERKMDSENMHETKMKDEESEGKVEGGRKLED